MKLKLDYNGKKILIYGRSEKSIRERLKAMGIPHDKQMRFEEDGSYAGAEISSVYINELEEIGE